MKTTAVFQQSGHLPVQHDQSGLQPSTNAFNQQLQQHLLPTQVQQQQQQQQQQLQQVQQQHRGQHVQQLHRLSQSHMASIHSAQPMVSASTNQQQTGNVFPNADFFQTLQQTAAAAALPTVLPYDQSQYIGQLMYFPYPTAATNGLFGATPNPDSSQQSNQQQQHHHHMTAALCTANQQSVTNSQPTGSLGDQSNLTTSATSCTSAGSRIISVSTSGVGLVGGQQLNNTNHIPGCTPTAGGISSSTASLSPLFTTAQFYHQQQATIATSQQQQSHIQQLHHHTPQPQTHHLQSLPLPQMQHSQPPPVHSIAMLPQHVVGQQQRQPPPSATLLLSSPLQPSSTPSVATVASNIVLPTSGSNTPAATIVAVSQPHVPHLQSVPIVSHHIKSTVTETGEDGVGKSSTGCANSNNNGNAAGTSNHCDGNEDGGEEEVTDDSSQHPIHSTPNHTPVKQQQPAFDSGDSAGVSKTENTNNMTRMTGASNPLNGSNAMEVTPVSVKRDNTGTGHFVCGVCGREFGMRCRLIAHTRRHTGERPFPCADCGRAFSDRGNLQRHRYTHSSQPRFHCSVCGKLFRQASCLSNHRRFHCAGATGRPCPFCQRSFRSSSSLQMHIRWKHRADAAAAVAAAAAAVASSGGGGCSAGNLSSPINAGALMVAGQQQQQHTLQSVYPCSGAISYPNMHCTVNGTMDSSDLLRAAAAVAASAGVVNNCTTSTSTRVTSGSQLCLPVGVQQAVGLPHSLLLDQLTFPYDVTGMGVGSSTAVGSPNKRKWRRKTKPKQQSESYTFGKFTNDGLNLLAGFQLTDGTGLSAMGTPIDMNAAVAAAGAAAMGGSVPLDRKGRPCNFSCPACPRRFAFQCRLAAHIRCHTNIRPFICIDCGRAFTQRGYLVRHAAVHKLDRPFTCALCDRSYKHYGSLVNHRRTHGKPSSVLGNMSLLSAGRSAHLAQCYPTVSGVGTISSLEEVVGGSLTGTKMNENDGQTENVGNGGNGCGRATTITLLPVSKVEEILPGDLAGPTSNLVSRSEGAGESASVHSSANVVSAPTASIVDQPHAIAIPPISSLPHQLTATAVWPILAGAGVGQAVGPAAAAAAAAHLISPGGVQQSMVGASHFPTLSFSSHLGQVAVGSSATVVGNQPHYHLQAQRTPQQQHANTPMLSSSSVAPSTPTYVTVPIFGAGGTTSQSQQVATTTGVVDSTIAAGVPTVVVSTSVGSGGGLTAVNVNTHPSHHHPFHTGMVGGTVTTTSSSVSDQQATAQHMPPHRTATGSNVQQQSLLPAQLSQLTQQQSGPGGMSAAPTGDTAGGTGSTVSSAPVLHVLQPSPSIFFSPYYLPHTATSQM